MNDITPTMLAGFMAQASKSNPKALWETDEQYKQRLYVTAHPAFEAYMAEQHAKKMLATYGEKADLRDRLARQREGFDFNQTVRELKKELPRYPNENPYGYHRRIVQMARELEAASYGGAEGQRARREEVAARVAAREQWRREQEQPVQKPMSVREERLHPKQKKLLRAKAKYTYNN